MKRWFIWLCFCLLAIVLTTSLRTDADLSDQELIPENSLVVALLDLENQQTANFQNQSSLFQITGLMPGGFAVASARIRNQGSFNYAYRISPSQISSDDLCAQLEITLLQDWKVLYQGPLVELNYSAPLASGAYDDFVFSIKLSESTQALPQSVCTFAIRFSSDTPVEQTPLYDEELIQNQIVTGTW